MCRVVSSRSSLGRIVWAVGRDVMFGLGRVFQSLYPESAVLSGAGSSRVAFGLDGGQCGNACEGGWRKSWCHFRHFGRLQSPWWTRPQVTLHAAALDMFLSCVYLWDLTLAWQGRKVWCLVSGGVAQLLMFGRGFCLVWFLALPVWLWSTGGDVGKLRHWNWETVRSANYPESCWSCFELHSSVLLTPSV